MASETENRKPIIRFALRDESSDRVTVLSVFFLACCLLFFSGYRDYGCLAALHGVGGGARRSGMDNDAVDAAGKSGCSR